MRCGKNNRFGKSLWLAAALAPALVLGCSSDKKADAHKNDFFPGENEARSVDRVVEASAAAGAKSDATLYASHFDGGDLNTSGQTKLDLMLQHRTQRQPVTLYMSLPSKDPMEHARRDSVTRYLRNGGYAAADVELKAGDNPLMRSNVNDGLKNLRKTDSDYQSGGQQGGGYQPSSMQPGAAATGGNSH